MVLEHTSTAWTDSNYNKSKYIFQFFPSFIWRTCDSLSPLYHVYLFFFLSQARIKLLHSVVQREHIKVQIHRNMTFLQKPVYKQWKHYSQLHYDGKKKIQFWSAIMLHHSCGFAYLKVADRTGRSSTPLPVKVRSGRPESGLVWGPHSGGPKGTISGPNPGGQHANSNPWVKGRSMFPSLLPLMTENVHAYAPHEGFYIQWNSTSTIEKAAVFQQS